MFKASNIHYEIDDRVQGISNGGIGAVHLLAKKTGLLKEIDASLSLLKRHYPITNQIMLRIWHTIYRPGAPVFKT